MPAVIESACMRRRPLINICEEFSWPDARRRGNILILTVAQAPAREPPNVGTCGTIPKSVNPTPHPVNHYILELPHRVVRVQGPLSALPQINHGLRALTYTIASRLR